MLLYKIVAEKKSNLDNHLPDHVKDAARDDVNDALKDAQSLSEDQQDIWTPGFILFIIIVGIIVGICGYKVIQWFINRKESNTPDKTQDD